ncbi:Hypothetical protein FKW44_025157 [Caligus rogercresseyi]|uniref:Uncharacterized protein n=1 Tax=Caligus rogercresseyi TaxID=217165 RepID=A0A7T8GK98_CALRO|nr:Hypothetical protein FKW44_025157 [Caligus rogercresseyi]
MKSKVLESGLADGSSPNDDDILNSSFTLTALDGLDSISINGTNISAAALANSGTTPVTITTTIGALVVNGYAMAADGSITVDYTYTLSDNQNHSTSTVNDDFTLVVTDTDGDTRTDVLNISIVDDVPSVLADSNTINEDSVSVTGDVFSNDTLGADQTATPITGIAFGSTTNDVVGQLNTSVSGNYGALVLQTDGSYVYSLDNTNLAVQGLTAGESLTDTFTYTLTDSDGDTATTTLTLTIDGTNDGVSLTIPDNVGPAGGDEEQVLESGLADGSTPNDDDILNSSFTLTALDGLQTLVVAGVNVDAADLANSTASPIAITTTAGTIVLNGHDLATDGTITVDYTYTLADNQDHSTSTVNDDITIEVIDTDSDSTSDVLNINIIDDVPTVLSDSNSINEDSVSVTGDVFTNDTLGPIKPLRRSPVLPLVAVAVMWWDNLIPA